MTKETIAPPAQPAPIEERAFEVAELLKLLANQHRLLILCTLTHGPLTVNRIWEQVPSLSQSALSQNLARMRSAGLLKSEKSGLNVTYSIADPRILSVMAVLEENYCHGSDGISPESKA